jgi:UDP-glucose 4-epimerase
MNALVTGGAGFVGSVCTEQLLAAGTNVLVLDNLVAGHRGAVPSGADLVEGDYGDSRLVGRLIRDNRIEAVMHFAGETLVEKSMTDPRSYFDANVKKGIDFLNTLIEQQVTKIIFSSTAAVYGEPQEKVITEMHRKEPINAYGESKLMFERILDWYRRAYGLEYIAVRYFNAAGASLKCGEDHSPESHLIPLLLESVISPNRKFTIFGDDYDTADGTCVRDYVHVLDIAQAHILALHALQRGHFGEYNLGSGMGFSVMEVLRVVEEVTGHKVSYRVGPRRKGDPAFLVASNEKARRELNWNLKHSTLDEIVQSAWKWKRAHPGGYVREHPINEQWVPQN